MLLTASALTRGVWERACDAYGMLAGSVVSRAWAGSAIEKCVNSHADIIFRDLYANVEGVYLRR